MSKANTKSRKFVVILVIIAIMSAVIAFGSGVPWIQDALGSIRFIYRPCGSADSAFAFFNVGNGDASAVYTNKVFGLIDTGWDTKVGALIGQLEKLKIESIDFIVLSHPHEDHAGGYLHLLQSFTIGKLFVMQYDADDFENITLYESILTESKKAGTEVCYVTHGDCFTMQDVVLNFYEQATLVEDENDNSLIVKASAGGVSCLYMGDAGHLVENRLMLHNCDLKADILKVGHHGSSDATGQEFIKSVGPKYAVISVGANQYDHPSDEVIARLQKTNVQLYRTDVCSKITFYATEKQWEVKVD